MELETTRMDWMLAIENFEGLHSVPIMTIHKSKGLEYNAVYFVGLEDSAFWSFKNQLMRIDAHSLLRYLVPRRRYYLLFASIAIQANIPSNHINKSMNSLNY